MPELVVTIGAAGYFAPEQEQTKPEERRANYASYGEVINVSDEQAARLRELGAVQERDHPLGRAALKARGDQQRNAVVATTNVIPLTPPQDRVRAQVAAHNYRGANISEHLLRQMPLSALAELAVGTGYPLEELENADQDALVRHLRGDYEGAEDTGERDRAVQARDERQILAREGATDTAGLLGTNVTAAGTTAEGGRTDAPGVEGGDQAEGRGRMRRARRGGAAAAADETSGEE